MTTQIQKEEERVHFYEFKKFYSGFPQGIVDDNREEPDFLIKTTNIVIGVEHIDYIRDAKMGSQSSGSLLRRAEIIRDEFIKIVKKHFNAKHLEPLIVSFSWYGNKLPDKRSMTNLAEYTVRIIESELPLKLSSYKSIDPEKLENTPLEDYLYSITISRPAKLERSSWLNNEIGWTELQADEIYNLVSGKEKKIDTYLKSCDKVWLLIVANAEHISSVFDISNQPITYSLPTKFEKIFLYDRLHQRIIALK